LHIYENIHIISQLYLKHKVYIYTSYSGLGFMRVHIGNDWHGKGFVDSNSGLSDFLRQ